jgi:hypothetical protein
MRFVSVAHASQAEGLAEKAPYFVIPSEARNLSSIYAPKKKERFLAPLGMTKQYSYFSYPLKPALPFQKSFLAGRICFEIAAETVKIGSFTTWLRRRFIATLHSR